MFDIDNLFCNNADSKQKNYNLVHPLDLDVVEMITPSEDGPWIAGGACLKWYSNNPIGESDIDVFCADENQSTLLIERLTSTLQHIFKTQNATTFRHYHKNKIWNIQVITKKYYNSLEELVNSFDITVCEIGTDGNRWVFGEQFAKDFNTKTLRMKYPFQDSVVKRLLKYWVYGYRPVDGLVEEIIKNPKSRWKFTPDEDYS